MSDGTKKICPCCGKPMEDFAVAWGWKHCYDCSGADVKGRYRKLWEAAGEDDEFPFGRCKNCNKEFNSELISEYSIECCPWCGTRINYNKPLGEVK